MLWCSIQSPIVFFLEETQPSFRCSWNDFSVHWQKCNSDWQFEIIFKHMTFFADWEIFVFYLANTQSSIRLLSLSLSLSLLVLKSIRICCPVYFWSWLWWSQMKCSHKTDTLDTEKIRTKIVRAFALSSLFVQI